MCTVRLPRARGREPERDISPIRPRPPCFVHQESRALIDAPDDDELRHDVRWLLTCDELPGGEQTMLAVYDVAFVRHDNRVGGEPPFPSHHGISILVDTAHVDFAVQRSDVGRWPRIAAGERQCR